MNKLFNVTTFVVSIIVGCAFVILLAFISGSFFAAPRLPILAILSGFIIAGIAAGATSRQVTILEPGIGGVIVGIASFFLIQLLNLKAFLDLSSADLTLVMLNGIILTFVGAWIGEKLQSDISADQPMEKKIEWGWILCGMIIGVTISMLLASTLVVLLGVSLTILFICFLVGLLITGFLVGWRSHGVTIIEAALAGFLTVIVDIDIIVLTLVPIGRKTMGLGILIGMIVTMIGGFIGEKIQGKKQTS